MLHFTVLTFAISWILWGLVAVTGIDINENLTAGLAYIMGGFGPAIAGFYLSRRKSQAPGELWERIIDVKRIRRHWWLFILFLYPLTLLAATAIAGLVGDGSSVLSINATTTDAPLAFFILTILFIAVVGPVSEEPGWRGYALDRLQRRYSPLVASLFLGIVWWAWHLPLIFVRGSFLYESGVSFAFLAGYLGTVVLYSILFTWVYNHTQRSVLATILMHFSVNMTTGLLRPAYEVFVITTFLLILIAGIITIRDRLWRRAPQGQ